MFNTATKTPEEYLSLLPEDRREALSKVRDVIVKNLPKGYEEVINWGMITYEIPLSTYSDTYNGKPLMYAALASHKTHMAVYLTNVYGNKDIEGWFVSEYKKSGKKLDMGKSCVRFKKLEDLALELIGQTVAKTSTEDLIKIYDNSRNENRGK